MSKLKLVKPENTEDTTSEPTNEEELELESTAELDLESTEEDPETDDDQELVEVSQTEVKLALKALLLKENELMSTLYLKHDEFNREFFDGMLPVPVITFDKMSNKTLGNMTPGTDNMGLESRIRFNKNFIALNTETRILETLKHEMIHQYQDEFIYERHDKEGTVTRVGQKRPKEWHNTDFKDWAKKVGIPAIGRKGGGNPAIMPEAKSYNRKFVCECVATNGYPLTIWSTREIHATCNTCECEFTEVKKAGKVIEVRVSDIEVGGKDAVQLRMAETFTEFERYQVKGELTAKVKELKKLKAKYQEGIYQRGHRKYSEGFFYWIAWNVPAPKKSKEPKAPKKPRAKKGAVTHDEG